MPAPIFDTLAGKLLSRKLDEALPATIHVADRVARADLERDVRFAGTLLAAASAAERAMLRSPDVAALVETSARFVEKLDRAAAAVEAVHARALAAVARPPASV